MRLRPLAIDLFCGLGGWTEGLLAEGWNVIGFDVERHAYGEHRYPAQLVLQDIRTLHGAQFASASLIVASSPCQEFSYRAMPWKRAKALGPPLLGMELFVQAERIQREAIAAAGRFIPMVQENVRGAQPFVGRARWHYGSYYLWGDVPALMPITVSGIKVKTMGAGWYPPSDPRHVPGLGFNTHAERQLRAEDSVKVGGPRGDDLFTQHNRPEFEDRATKNAGGSWFNVAHNTTSGKGQNPDGRKTEGHVNQRDGAHHTPHLTNQAESDAVRMEMEGVKQRGSGAAWFDAEMSHKYSSKSLARKAASARIAKIPLALARHIGKAWYPLTPTPTRPTLPMALDTD